MGALARVLERFELSTVALSLIRAQIETTRPPRALHCEFPLGRPLGRPGEPDFQHRVLRAAFGLLEHRSGPVLEEFPEAVEDVTGGADQPLSCVVPLADDRDLHPAVSEVIGLRDAYERQLARTGRTGVGRVIGADDVRSGLELLIGLAEEAPTVEGESLGHVADIALDVRSYFEEAAAELSANVPAAGAAEAWFFQETHAGKVLLDVKRQLRVAGYDRSLWWGIAPLTQEPEEDRSQSWTASRRY